MIEKCSIGNMTNNIQNITLILLILILIIVIIYYLKNSNAKHNVLIEKYTNTPIESDASYITHYSANSQKNSNFPSSGTTVTLRDCQVQFNNTFTKDDNVTVDDNATVKYTYGDEWKEIDTLTEPGSSPIKIPEKIISRSNETNAADITNYSERTKCFRRMSSTASDNKYRYAGNNLIQYREGSASVQGIHSELKVGANGTPENYMEMKFNLAPSNSDNYYNNLTSSICSLQYTNNLGGNNGSGLGGVSLYRLTLDTNNKITAINQITINSTNNHIFTVSQTTSFADLLTSTSTISYVYSGGNFNFQSNSSLSTETNLIGVKIYKFNRELLCSHVQNNIKSYQIFDNKTIDANKIVNVSAASVTDVINSTSFPDAASSYASKNAVKTAIEERINTEIATANADAISEETTANTNITTYTTARDTFLTSINTRDKFLDKIFDNTLVVSKRNFLVSTSGLINGLNLNTLGYQTLDVSSDEIILNSSEEPSFSKIVNNTPTVIYETIVLTYKDSPYDITFPPNTSCKILIVGGGGGGGQFGGGGGGGSILFNNDISLSGRYIITVGKGGKGQEWNNFGVNGENGKDSIIQKFNVENEKFIAKGGGGGGTRRWWVHNCNWCGVNGNDGGSGGGGSHSNTPGIKGLGGVSNKNTYTGWESYGNNGGNGRLGIAGSAPDHASGGGGGAGSVGGDFSNSTGGGNGGSGKEFITTFGSSVGHNGWFGGGGGGNTYYGAGNPGYGNGGNGLLGGGGNGGYDPDLPATDGIEGTGGGGGGGKWSTANKIKGGDGGSGIVIIKYRNVPVQNENEKQITLKYNNDNKLIFTYRTDEPNYSWDEAYNEAIANGKRMPTIQELRDYMDSSPTVFSQFDGKDVWIPVINTDINNNKDWVQAGNLWHSRKKSHTQHHGYPGWGNGTSADYAKVYFEVKDSYQSITYNFNPYDNLTSWKNYATSIGATTNVDSFDSTHGVWYPNDGVGYLSLTLNNNNYNYVKVYFGCTYPNGRVVLRINDEDKETCYPGQFKTYSQRYNKGDVLTIAELSTSIIARNLTITLENRILNYRTILPTQTDVTLNGTAKTLQAGTYDITMGPTSSEIKNRATNIVIGNYAHRDGNKLEFKYAIRRTLEQIHNDTSVSSSAALNTINNDLKYSLGYKTAGEIIKYKAYIYRRHGVTHTLTLYADNTLLTNGTQYVASGTDEDVVPKKINLYNYEITISENISGNIYLKSDKPIFFISETNRTTFNNTTDTQFGTNVNNLKASNSSKLTSLNNLFEISSENTALTTARGKKITYNIDSRPNSESPLTINYNSSTIDIAGRNSLDNLKTTYNNIHRYNESSGGALTEKINEHTFGNIFDHVETDIEEYISYEYPTAPTDDKLTPSTRNTPFNIRSNATKYVYFRKSS